MDWQLVRNKAAEIVEQMVYKMPELKNKLHFPRGPTNLYNIMPVGSSFHQRHRVKNLDRRQSTHVAQFYLKLKKRMPSSSQGESHGYSAGSAGNGWETLIALLEKALQAGRRSVLKQGHSSEYLSKEVFPLKAMLTRGAMVLPLSSQGHRPEHSSKQDTSHSPIVASPETNADMKRSRVSP
uniref:Uncharacterized protein n=1 Tax=Arundo donax TaxID=35708 RepID=A0A0A8Y8G1_ARUDO